MTRGQQRKLKALAKCTFRPASFDKRFVRDLNSLPPTHKLSGKQAAYLDKIYHSYRRQIPTYKPEPAPPISRAQARLFVLMTDGGVQPYDPEWNRPVRKLASVHIYDEDALGLDA